MGYLSLPKDKESQHSPNSHKASAGSMTELQSVRMMGSPVHVLRAADRSPVLHMVGDGTARTVLFCNVHMLMLAKENPALAHSINSADLVFADGVPIAWLQRHLGFSDACVLRGYEAMLALCAMSEERGGRIGIFGSSEQTLKALENEIHHRFPDLVVAYSQSPGFSEPYPRCDAEELKRINAANLDFLFVGLGCPKQELWMQEYQARLNCTLLGVGAAFDWLSGLKPMPPRWMEQHGLGWLGRLVQEPRRLGKRYFLYNIRFLAHATKDLVFHRKQSGLSSDQKRGG